MDRGLVSLNQFGKKGPSVSHTPSNGFIGRDRIQVSYYGQPKLCFKCGSPTHFSADCTLVRCMKCNGQGHTAEGWRMILCNLCGELGCPFSRCPAALRSCVTEEAVLSLCLRSNAGSVAGSWSTGQEKLPLTQRRAERRKLEREQGKHSVPEPQMEHTLQDYGLHKQSRLYVYL